MIRHTLRALAAATAVTRGVSRRPSTRSRPRRRASGRSGAGRWARVNRRPRSRRSTGASRRTSAGSCPLQGEGKSTPVVWGDLVFITSASDRREPRAPRRRPTPEAAAASLRRSRRSSSWSRRWAAPTARYRWRKVVHTERPHEGHHADGTYASGSILTDGTLVYAFYGSRGLYALDLAGNVKWYKQLGQMQTRNGFGEGQLAGASRRQPASCSGTTRAPTSSSPSTRRPGRRNGGASATSRRRGRRRTSSCTAASRRSSCRAAISVVSYDLATGETLWQTGGLTANVIPTPVSGDGFVYAMSGFRGNMARAIRLAGREGRSDRRTGAGLDLRPRHAIRAVAAAVPGLAVLPQVEQRAS